MTTRIERIKEMFPSMRSAYYRPFRFFGFTERNWMVGTDRQIKIHIAPYSGWHESEEEAWEGFLGRVLKMKALTGARINNLTEMVQPYVLMEACGNDDPDEAIAELWRKVFIDEPVTT